MLQLHQGEAHQRWIQQIKTLLHILAAQVFQALLLSLHLLPVEMDEERSRPLMHDLQGLFQSFPNKTGTQYRMAINHPLPGLLESADVEIALKSATKLLNISS